MMQNRPVSALCYVMSADVKKRRVQLKTLIVIGMKIINNTTRKELIELAYQSMEHPVVAGMKFTDYFDLIPGERFSPHLFPPGLIIHTVPRWTIKVIYVA